jgi:uncharacterized protein
VANHDITHIDIPAADLDRVTRFYEQAFGWTIDRSVEGYPMFRDATDDSGGGFTTSLEPGQAAGIVPYINVDDVRAALAAVASAGGETVQERAEIPGQGHYATFRDSEGNTLGVADGLPHG